MLNKNLDFDINSKENLVNYFDNYLIRLSAHIFLYMEFQKMILPQKNLFYQYFPHIF